MTQWDFGFLLEVLPCWGELCRMTASAWCSGCSQTRVREDGEEGGGQQEPVVIVRSGVELWPLQPDVAATPSGRLSSPLKPPGPCRSSEYQQLNRTVCYLLTFGPVMTVPPAL